tara:strand:- start:9606 stop:10253 length:648 start_codon:yes stop_codon:yes gene_type:complete
MTNSIDFNQLSSSELERLLDEKRKKENQEQTRKKRKYTEDRDRFVLEMAERFSLLSRELKQLKNEAITRSGEFRDRAYDLQHRTPKKQRQFSLITEDGNCKLVVENQDHSAFNEHAQVAIERIKEILYNKFASRNKAMYNIINNILMKNNRGDYDPKLVAKLRKHEEDINNPEFSQALNELSKSYYSTGTATYLRVYVKDENNRWQDIPMQFSSL